jgi:hypothetical protein
MTKKLKYLSILLTSSIAIYGCSIYTDISSFLGWRTTDDVVDNSLGFVVLPPNFNIAEGADEDDPAPTPITFSIRGNVPDNCIINGLTSAGIPVTLPIGIRSGTTYATNAYYFLEIINCTTNSNATVTVSYTSGGQTYKGTSTTINMNKNNP